MLTHRRIDLICIAFIAFAVLLAAGYAWLSSSGVLAPMDAMQYQTRLFDDSRVHTIDIQMQHWDAFLAACPQEQYGDCTLVIDGELYRNVALRAKGNASLATLAQQGSARYSFKAEFDHYDKNVSYHGLDKLCLNNLIGDDSCMKDYVAYAMMRKTGVAAPLCSYAFITVNGEPFGLYMAAEAVEDSFLARNYGMRGGELYKPETGAVGTDEDDVKLLYLGDDPESYPNIFNNAKTKISQKDRERLITALKTLSQGGDIASAVNAEAVIRYLAAHSFLCNDDSYTGTAAQNYYLHEKGGRLSFIPWDYDMAFGDLSGDMRQAMVLINASVDAPVTSGDVASRPMVSWIFADAACTDRYHAVYAELLETLFDSGWFSEEFDRVRALIAPYIAKDPTAFCTPEQFQSASDTLWTLCTLRAQSVERQLAQISEAATAAPQATRTALSTDAPTSSALQSTPSPAAAVQSTPKISVVSQPLEAADEAAAAVSADVTSEAQTEQAPPVSNEAWLLLGLALAALLLGLLIVKRFPFVR